MKKALPLAAALCLLATTLFAADEKEKSTVELNDESDKVSYAIGIQVGSSLDLPGFEIALEPFFAGVEDVLNDREPALDAGEVETIMQAFQAKMREAMMAEQNQEAAKNQAEGQKFLDAKKAEEGVMATESGLLYKVVEDGAGAMPKATDEVTVHYTGTLINGEKFDSSVDRGTPATFELNQVIPGWTEGVQLMKEGAKYQFYIPADLAYGERGRPGIPPNSVLIFDIELISVKSTVQIPTDTQ